MFQHQEEGSDAIVPQFDACASWWTQVSLESVCRVHSGERTAQCAELGLHGLARFRTAATRHSSLMVTHCHECTMNRVSGPAALRLPCPAWKTANTCHASHRQRRASVRSCIRGWWRRRRTRRGATGTSCSPRTPTSRRWTSPRSCWPASAPAGRLAPFSQTTGGAAPACGALVVLMKLGSTEVVAQFLAVPRIQHTTSSRMTPERQRIR